MWNMHENQCAKYVQSQQWMQKNNVCDIVVMSLVLTSEVWVLRTQLNIYNGGLFTKILGSKYTSDVWIYFTHCCDVSIVDFKHVNFGWLTSEFSAS